MRDKKQLKTLMAMFFFVFIIVNIYGISQIGHKPRVSAPFEGPAGEPNTLGGYQVIMTALAVGFTIHSRSFATKASMISIIGLTLAPFLYTLSRSSYLALVVMFLTMTIVASRGRRRLLVSLLVLSALTAALLPNEVRERIKDTFTAHPSEDIPVQAVFGVKVGPSASARLLSYKQVFADFIKSPVTGYGVTGKGFLDSQFVTTLLETGTLGMIGFLFMLYGVARHTLRVYRTAGDSFYKGMALGFFCAHIAMIAHAITANTFIIIRIMEPYWFIAAMLMAVPRIEAAENESLTAVQEDDAPRGIRNVELMVGKA
jgi:hypothetical protein